MIHFITDVWPGETDILGPIKHEALLILNLDGELIVKVSAPAPGWTHDDLVAENEKLTSEAQYGAEAFLGSEWVGSTEV